MKPGNIPVLVVEEDTIPLAYEKAIREVWEKGIKSFFEKLENRSFEERTWHSNFVKSFFIDDGVGKGLRPMLKREKDMPKTVRKAVE
jgi:hypothetical protein